MDDSSATIFYLLVLSRWIHFAAVFVVFGCSFFWFYIGRGPLSAIASLPLTAAKARRSLQIAAVLTVVTGITWLGATIANVTGGFANLGDFDTLHVFFFETPFGTIWIARLVLFVLLATVACVRTRPLIWMSLILSLGAMLLGSQAWLGHAAEGGHDVRGIMMLAAYVVHVLGAAAWVGGLPFLAFAISERQDGAKTHDLLQRYSMMAMLAVALIVGSGIANTAAHAESFGLLISSRYGGVLAAKLVMVALMLALAAVNRGVLMPRLGDDAGTVTKAYRTIRWSIAAEIALSIITVLAAAVLGITPPPH